MKTYFGLQVKNFKLLIFILFCSCTFLLSNTYASHFDDLPDDCGTFNLDASCRPKPIKKVIPPRTNFIKDELLILYPSTDASSVNKITKKYNLKPTSKVILTSIKTGLIVAKTNGQSPLALTKTINKKEKNVEALPNNIFKTASTQFKKAYSLSETGVNTVHRITKGKGIDICMVDTPVDIFHPSFSNAHIETKDLTQSPLKNLDGMAHGTSVAGVLVSQNALIGVAPQARLLAIGAFSMKNSAPFTVQGLSGNIAKAINICIQSNVDVINLSFTGGRDPLIEKLIKKAISKGIVVVAAGGNGGHWGSSIYPALIPGVLAVTAVDDNKQLFPMADKGRFIDYAAPGVNILTLAPDSTYTISTGTSLAAAHLSGIVALLLSQQRGKPIDSTLKQTAVDLGKPGRDQEYGDGLVSASKALAIIKNK